MTPIPVPGSDTNEGILISNMFGAKHAIPSFAEVQAGLNSRVTKSYVDNAINDALQEANSESIIQHVVYLGQIGGNEPTPDELSTFAGSKAQIIFGDASLKTGYTVRDRQDRDWRWVDDAEIEPIYDISVSPASIDFGQVTQNVIPSTVSVTVKNIGNQPITLAQPSASNQSYTMGNLSATSLPSKNSQATFTVVPSSTAAVGTLPSTLTITGKDGSGTTKTTKTISVTCAVVAPTQKTISVGNQSGAAISGVTANQSIAFPVTTANISNGTYPVTMTGLTGVTAGNIAISNNSGTLSLTVATAAAIGSSSRTIAFDEATSNSFNIAISAGVISFSAQPSNASVTAGSINQTLNVAASSTATASSISYQWHMNSSSSNVGGTPVNGATNASFSITSTLSPGTYYFYAVASGSKGEASASSSVATVTVAAAQQDNRMFDAKDGQYYDTIQVGDLWWTARNYAYAGNGIYWNNGSAEQFAGQGLFYSWADAVANAPSGWRLATEEEWNTLRDSTGATAANGVRRLRTTSGWTANSATQGEDTIGFGWPPSGYRNATTFTYLGERAGSWRDGQNNRVFISSYSANLSFDNENTGNYRMAVRYVKEAT